MFAAINLSFIALNLLFCKYLLKQMEKWHSYCKVSLRLALGNMFLFQFY